MYCVIIRKNSLINKNIFRNSRYFIKLKKKLKKICFSEKKVLFLYSVIFGFAKIYYGKEKVPSTNG